MAWLQATPDSKDNKKDKKSRMEILSGKDRDHPSLTLPPLESHSYIIEWLFDVGPGMSFGMGLCPLTYQEINAWAEGIDINPWERGMLKSLSSEYISWSNKSSKEGCIAPYSANVGLPSKEKSNEISNSMAEMFRGMTNPKRNGGLK